METKKVSINRIIQWVLFLIIMIFLLGMFIPMPKVFTYYDATNKAVFTATYPSTLNLDEYKGGIYRLKTRGCFFDCDVLRFIVTDDFKSIEDYNKYYSKYQIYIGLQKVGNNEFEVFQEKEHSNERFYAYVRFINGSMFAAVDQSVSGGGRNIDRNTVLDILKSIQFK